MTVTLNEVRRGVYLDSVALMRMAREITALPGVEDAGLMIGSPANRDILREARLLSAEGDAAGPGDLIVALRAADKAAAETALAHARALLDKRRPSATEAGGTHWQARTLRRGIEMLPDANLALVSVPGGFATAEASKALQRGLNVMIFSDNVPLAEEVALKREAQKLGLLVMGPDCGTAIIGGVPLAFANVVPRGPIAIIGASGTGIQEVSCLIAQRGGGISHAIGTGGRDLKSEVGGITTLMAIDLLDNDPETRHIVLISKPPSDDVARAVLARVSDSRKPFTICFLGARDLPLPPNAKLAPTLEAAALLALASTGAGSVMSPAASAATSAPRAPAGAHLVRGLFAGGTLCSEAQIVALGLGASVTSNVPVPGARPLPSTAEAAHRLIDLGDDAFTRGRPHPMIEPAVRDEPLAAALADPHVGAVLTDIVLGTGSHADPAGHLARALAKSPQRRALVIASVTGTDADPQNRSRQVRTLADAGIIVAGSNAEAARLAFQSVVAH